jgi:hypothetical protein
MGQVELYNDFWDIPDLFLENHNDEYDDEEV